MEVSMKFFLSVLMLSVLSLNVACTREDDGVMEREEAPLERAGEEIGHEADEVGDKLEDAGEELND